MPTMHTALSVHFLTLLPFVLCQLDARKLYMESPRPASVTITGIASKGDGCPPGSMKVLPNGTITGPAMEVRIGPRYGVNKSTAANPGPDRSWCEVALELTYPNVTSWKYQLFDAEFFGSIDLEKGAVGQMRLHEWFGNGTSQVGCVIRKSTFGICGAVSRALG
jgi:hypothetical protein